MNNSHKHTHSTAAAAFDNNFVYRFSLYNETRCSTTLIIIQCSCFIAVCIHKNIKLWQVDVTLSYPIHVCTLWTSKKKRYIFTTKQTFKYKYKNGWRHITLNVFNVAQLIMFLCYQRLFWYRSNFSEKPHNEIVQEVLCVWF